MLVFLGERSAGPLAMAILAEVMVLMSLGAVLISGSGSPRVLARALSIGQTVTGHVAFR